MINPDKLTKRYYKIGEVAEMFDVATSLIRYWETEFSQLNPMKGKSGIRRYQKEDILIIDQIYQLVKTKGYKIKGAKKELGKRKRSGQESNKNLIQLRDKLQHLKSQLTNLKTELSSQ